MEYKILVWEKDPDNHLAEGMVEKLTNICLQYEGISRKPTIAQKIESGILRYVRDEFQVGTLFVINRYNNSLNKGKLRTEISFPEQSEESREVMNKGLRQDLTEFYDCEPNSKVVKSRE
jgi:hypothetical protein